MSEATGRQYRDVDGRPLFVHDGISQGQWWGTFRRRGSSGSLQRKKTLALPMRTTRAAAQADLDAYARRHGLPAVERP